MSWDSIIMVDWSGGNDRGPAPKADAIWICAAGQSPIYMRNRLVAENWLDNFLATESNAGRRTLVGFDFAFAYPQGFAQVLTGLPYPLNLWDWFEARIQDCPRSNNRFDLAGKINAMFPGVGPFWSNGLKRDIDNLPRKNIRHGHGMAERRAVEKLTAGTFTQWQLAGAGAVGSQTMMGLPVLARLRRKFDVAVWPFEPLDRAIGFVEIWPSLMAGPAPMSWVKDAWQVHACANKIRSLTPSQLERILTVNAPLEGWILGANHQSIFEPPKPPSQTAPSVNTMGPIDYRQKFEAPKPPPLRNDCFALPAGVEWMPVDHALAQLKTGLHSLTETHTLPLNEAAGQVLAENVHARLPHPPHANTAVDGYGFAAGRGAGVHRLPLLAGQAAAGDLPSRVPAGHAVRILTGAALPAGVDTVVLQEDVSATSQEIAFHGPIRSGANTRRAGEDMMPGDLAAAAKERLSPAHLGLLAAVGISHVPVFAPLKVGVLSTGDELIPAGQPRRAGQIYDANRPMLMQMIARMGHIPIDLGIAPDDPTQLRARLNEGAAQSDAILTSGGASTGDKDHTAALLRREGTLQVWRIAMKPGRPLAFGLWGQTPVFGLPGNPVAAFVCSLIFARPALGVLAGQGWHDPTGYRVPANFTKSKKPGRREYLRARMSDGQAGIFPSEGSGRISGLAWADGLVELGDEAAQIRPGDLVRYLPFDGIFR